MVSQELSTSYHLYAYILCHNIADALNNPRSLKFQPFLEYYIRDIARMSYIMPCFSVCNFHKIDLDVGVLRTPMVTPAA